MPLRDWRHRRAALAKRRMRQSESTGSRVRIRIEIAAVVVAALATLISAITGALSLYQIKISRDQYHLTQEQTALSLKPYVSVVAKYTPDKSIGQFKYQVMNNGQTPATDFAISFHYILINPSDVVKDVPEGNFIKIGSIMPHVEDHIIETRLSDIVNKNRRELGNESKHLVLMVRYKYSSRFDHLISGLICHEMALTPDLGNISVLSPCILAEGAKP